MVAQVTLGKPIGNGFPMGAVVMSPALARGFDNGMQYFATCGGCTASGAAGVLHRVSVEWLLHRVSVEWLKVPTRSKVLPHCQCSPAKVQQFAVKYLHMRCSSEFNYPKSFRLATGLAVLEVLKEERLQQAALATGQYLRAGLQRLQARLASIMPPDRLHRHAVAIG